MFRLNQLVYNWYENSNFKFPFFSSMTQQPLLGQGLLLV